MALRSGISTSFAVFLLVTSVCCILSLSRTDNSTTNTTHRGISAEQRKMFRVPKYVPNLAMTLVMLIGIAAMVILMFKPGDLTTTGDEGQLTRRHYLHRKHSLRSIMFFFAVGSMLHLNYLIVEFVSTESWTHCDRQDITVNNASELIFHSVCIIFATCETIVCWIIKPCNFKPSQCVWHGVAIVQAANFAVWFDSLLKESYHRIYDNAEFFDSYFSFCNMTSQNRNRSETWSSDSSIAAKWFTWSIPFLFPVTIEFVLLVSETLLGKVISRSRSRNSDQSNHANVPAAGPANQETPLLPDGNENPNRACLPQSYTNSRCSKIFILGSFISNIFYSLLTILIFVGYKLSGSPDIVNQLQTFDNVFAIYTVLYDVFSILCCVVGILSCRKFRRPHSHTSFLEYLLLVATCGVLLQSMKRIMAFISSTDAPMLAWYVASGILDMCQSILQIVFYYFAKDVKLQPFDRPNDGQADSASSVAVFNAMLAVTSATNFFMWISDSFLLPEILPGITPFYYLIEQWPVFDNAVTPITIFFRFNSALLFWCIGTDVFQRDEHPERQNQVDEHNV